MMDLSRLESLQNQNGNKSAKTKQDRILNSEGERNRDAINTDNNNYHSSTPTNNNLTQNGLFYADSDFKDEYEYNEANTENKAYNANVSNISDNPSEKKGKLDNLLTKEFTLFGGGFSDKVKESFYLELSSLLKAGLDMRTVLQLLAGEQKKKGIKDIMERLVNDVVSGDGLSQAMQKNKVFTRYEYFTIEIGEETGRLVEVLEGLSNYFKSRITQRRQMISALTYPTVVFSVAAGAIFFMMNYVVPMFSDVFRRFGGELPFITRKVLAVSKLLQAHTPKLMLLLVILMVIYWQVRKKQQVRKYQSALLLKIPFVGDMIVKIQMARFSTTMALLTGAKVPLLQSLTLAKQVNEFYPLEKALEGIGEEIMSGMQLHESMAKRKLFPAKMVTLVKVGEETNQLELFFDTLSKRYGAEMEYTTSQLGKLIEPVIILILGVLVGVVLVAMYLPLFNLGNTVK